MDAASTLLERSETFRLFVRTCMDGWRFGWHEANGGNLTCVLSTSDGEAACSMGSAKSPWQALPEPLPVLAGRFVLSSAAGCHFRDMEERFECASGVVELDDQGKAWRTVWGFGGGAAPTSELSAHLLAHAALAQRTAAKTQEPGACAPYAGCLYHAHTPFTIALSHVLEPCSDAYNTALSAAFTEFVYLLPDGIGVVGRMTPGSIELAQATADVLVRHDACVWQGHGAIAVGATSRDAFGVIHTIEKAAHIHLLAHAVQ